MNEWNRRKRKTPLLHIILFAYWFVLLVWQNLGGGVNRSGVDLIIKCALIVMLGIYFFTHMTGIRRDILAAIVVWFTVYGVIKVVDGMEMSEVLYYFFPMVFVLMIYGIGWQFSINKAQLLQLCNMLIAVTAYIAIYAVIFCFDQFKNAFTVESAYGNELRSFLFSSHEYGMYLAFGIMAAILCLEFDTEGSKGKRVLYTCVIVLFSANLILTFSRTAILALIVMLLTYMFAFAKRKLKSIFFSCLIVAVLVILIVPTLRDFFWRIVMKENTDAGREDLIEKAMIMYNRGNFLEKAFGIDFAGVERMLKSMHGFSSFHNAYITQLICNGIAGVCILAAMSISSFCDIYATVKTNTQYSHLSKFFIGFCASAIIFMMFNTMVLYASSIDSFFLTMMTSIVPRYVNQAIRDGTFDPPKKEYDRDKLLRKANPNSGQ